VKEKTIRKIERKVGSQAGEYFILEIGWSKPDGSWVEGSPWTFWIMKGDPNNVKDAAYITQFKTLEEAEAYLKTFER